MKQIFRQAIAEEDTISLTVGLGLTGLQPPVGSKILLCKKIDTFEKAVTGTIKIEEALKLKAPKEVMNTQDTWKAVSHNIEAN